MKVLLTGASGYIGSQLLPLLASNHEVIALVRESGQLTVPKHLQARVSVVVGDLLKPKTLDQIPADVEAAYYLVHSMSSKEKKFLSLEVEAAQNFSKLCDRTETKQIIYLSGLAHHRIRSQHMAARRRVEEILAASSVPLTILRAGIIVGSGSASFEIIRDLVEKLPVMITPRWVHSRCQPIAIRDVLFYLEKVLGDPRCIERLFEIGGPDVLTYQQMLRQYAKVRGLHRLILNAPILTPNLSSYWLYFVTATNFSLAQALVNSLKMEAICEDRSIEGLLPHQCLSYKKALAEIFTPQGRPQFGVLEERVTQPLQGLRENALDRLRKIGGKTGWYYLDWAWKLRGAIDKWVGGPGLRCGRRDPLHLKKGDQIDCWRVTAASLDNGYLLLYSEMRLPGEAWLEFRVLHDRVVQTATFRPKGVGGRLYWYTTFPLHHLILRGLAKSIAGGG